MRRVALLLFLCRALAEGAWASGDLFSGQFHLQGAVIALYPATGLESLGVMRVEKSFTDYERKGFFRIGLLPIAVLEGVTIELPRQEKLEEGLRQAHRWFEPKAGKRLEVRRLRLVAGSPAISRLECGRAVAGPEGLWALSGGVIFTAGTNCVRAEHATLQVTGPRAGRVFLATSPPQTFNLFSQSHEEPASISTSLPLETRSVAPAGATGFLEDSVRR